MAEEVTQMTRDKKYKKRNKHNIVIIFYCFFFGE